MTSLDSEISLIRQLIDKYSLGSQTIRAKALDDLGYVIELHKASANITDWVFYDLDDTLVASWDAKDKRLGKYLNYCRTLGIKASDSCLVQLFEQADNYARWPEVRKPIYHFHAHIALLAEIINFLRDHREYNDTEVLRSVADFLKSLPVGVIPPAPQSKIEELKKVIFQDVVTPEIYPDATQSMTLLKNEGIGIGIFTYGEPYFQLLKSLELLQNSIGGQEVVSKIWLTKVSKGKFLQSATRALKGRLIVVDDSPAELDDMHITFDNHDARLHLVRSVRHNTKTVKEEWDMSHSRKSAYDTRNSSDHDLFVHIRQAFDSVA